MLFERPSVKALGEGPPRWHVCVRVRPFPLEPGASPPPTPQPPSARGRLSLFRSGVYTERVSEFTWFTRVKLVTWFTWSVYHSQVHLAVWFVLPHEPCVFSHHTPCMVSCGPGMRPRPSLYMLAGCDVGPQGVLLGPSTDNAALHTLYLHRL